jgi:hypothetical protein
LINLDNPRYIVWGFRSPDLFHTHSFIHSGFYRTLKLTGHDVQWLDHHCDISKVDFGDSVIISEHGAAKAGLPIVDSSFYVIHGMNDDPELREKMKGHKNRLSWNVFHDVSHGNSDRWKGQPLETVEAYNEFLKGGIPDSENKFDRVFLAEDTPFYINERHLDFRWATDLIPSEIEANKPGIVLTGNKVIHWIGTQWFVNAHELGEFKRACSENGVEFKASGAGQNGVVSIQDNIRLVRESYFAPAIIGSHHLTEGYISCRTFKNISYGRMGITNSKRANDIFGGRLIYEPDPYKLFYVAQEQLQSLPVEKIHELMDYVSANHTYINRIDSILKAARLVMEMR